MRMKTLTRSERIPRFWALTTVHNLMGPLAVFGKFPAVRRQLPRLFPNVEASYDVCNVVVGWLVFSFFCHAKQV